MIDQASLDLFASLFVGRRDDYAVQRESGHYVRVGSPLTRTALRAHLDGLHTLGTYVIDERGVCRFAVLDADSEDGLTLLAEVQARLAAAGIPSSLEASRRGGHLWVFLAQAVPASLVRRWLLPYVPPGVECYPKQDEACGYGSLIRLPLGIHQRSGRRYPFVTWTERGAVPVASSVRDTLAWCSTLARAAVPGEAMQPATHPTSPTHTHTSITTASRTALAPRYASIQDWCGAQDPYALIGRYVRLDSRGMGCCPFGEHHRDGKDTHPSLRVYAPARPGGCCWHCYTWGKGGNVFNFLALYHRLDARSLWSRIRAGEVMCRIRRMWAAQLVSLSMTALSRRMGKSTRVFRLFSLASAASISNSTHELVMECCERTSSNLS
jgi:hypothetical protein